MFTEVDTIRRFYLGKVILDDSGAFVCKKVYHTCNNMRRAIDDICVRAGASRDLPNSSQLPAPCSTHGTSPGMGKRLSKKKIRDMDSQDEFPSSMVSETEVVPLARTLLAQFCTTDETATSSSPTRTPIPPIATTSVSTQTMQAVGTGMGFGMGCAFACQGSLGVEGRGYRRMVDPPPLAGIQCVLFPPLSVGGGAGFSA